jgi:hypothetical protein
MRVPGCMLLHYTSYIGAGGASVEIRGRKKKKIISLTSHLSKTQLNVKISIHHDTSGSIWQHAEFVSRLWSLNWILIVLTNPLRAPLLALRLPHLTISYSPVVTIFTGQFPEFRSFNLYLSISLIGLLELIVSHKSMRGTPVPSPCPKRAIYSFWPSGGC